MTSPLNGRGDFDRLRAEGRRWSSGGLWCVHRAGQPGDPTRIAFAIGRNVGNAVVRNRIRRRLRAVLRTSSLPVGDYLFGAPAAAASMPSTELQRHVANLLDRARSRSGS